MKDIDYRRHYILVFDTETANGLDDPLFYDFGCAVIDTKGNVYETRSFVNGEIFFKERELMRSSYYAEKIPKYWTDILEGKRIAASFFEIRKAVADLMQKYRIKEVCAHNCFFDYKATNGTQRYLTKSKYRYFFPKGTIYWDSLNMARTVIAPMPTYKAFCERNNYKTARGQVRLTAEILYRFISGKEEFIESHTGLEDVLIEKEIIAYCYKQHKKMRKTLFNEKNKKSCL